MKKQVIYFENLSFQSFLIWIIKNSSRKDIFLKTKIYYFDINYLSKKILIPFLKIISIEVERLDFIMMDVKDENGELVRLRMSRLDLFELQQKIINSSIFKSIFHETFRQDSLIEYIKKGIIDGGITNNKSVSRIVYLILVIDWFNKRNKYESARFVINSRAWVEIYHEFSIKKNIELIPTNTLSIRYFRLRLYNQICNFPKIYNILKILKEQNFKNFSKPKTPNFSTLYLEGRGDISVKNNGYHSDFFWALNSNFPKERIVYKYVSNDEKEYLEKNNIFCVPESSLAGNLGNINYIKPIINFSSNYKKEKLEIQALLSSYEMSRLYWSNFFNLNNVKIFFTWYKYSNSHIAINDAIRSNGGISVLWQMAFDGFPVISSSSFFDISFCNSRQSYEIDNKLDSKIKYTVITGYAKDYAPKLLKDKAKKIKKQLHEKGVKKIIFAIDETSSDDSRWHTGHELQQENYLYLLEKIIETPWLGVIFKPKVAFSLRKRLGPVADLLVKAEKTGRCIVYEQTGRRHNVVPPILAGLSADICIHGHLSSGTAALECAIEGIPTLLIDREGTPFSKLYDLPKNKVIFKDWNSAIDKVMEHFDSKNGIPGFGDWSQVIDEMDPFRDGKAAFRIGTYMSWLIEGYNQGLEREVIMLNAAEKYQKIWGEDKVIYS